MYSLYNTSSIEYIFSYSVLYVREVTILALWHFHSIKNAFKCYFSQDCLLNVRCLLYIPYKPYMLQAPHGRRFSFNFDCEKLISFPYSFLSWIWNNKKKGTLFCVACLLLKVNESETSQEIVFNRTTAWGVSVQLKIYPINVVVHKSITPTVT